MSDTISTKKTGVLLLASVACNIFLAAFVLGRVSMMPPHMDGHPPIDGHPPFDGGGPPHDMHGDAGHDNGKFPHPPHLFSPEDLFTPDEMKADLPILDATFTSIQKVREEFIEKLKQGSVTEAEVLSHFSQIEDMMSAMKHKLQEKAAKKIASLTPEQRATFAEKMTQEHHH